MQILCYVKEILTKMKYEFSRKEVFTHFQCAIIGLILNCGIRSSITNLIRTTGNDQKDWTYAYRLFSTAKWDPSECCNILLKEGVHELPRSQKTIDIAIDLFGVRKTGRKIPFTNYQLDPLSPKFHPGLMWGQRFLHAALLIPGDITDLPGRAIPIQLEAAPYVKKPGKRASEEHWEAYRKAKKERNAMTQSITMIEQLLETMSVIDPLRRLRIVADGGFCNKTMFQKLPQGVELITRCRWDIKLCFQHKGGGVRFFEEKKFTPREVRQDEDTPWKETEIFYGGNWRNVRYKEVERVLWQGGAGRKPVRLLIIESQPYRSKFSGRIHFKTPVQILTTDFDSSCTSVIKAYFSRNDIEPCHRDMKNNLGLGQAQVWNPNSCERHPQTVLIAYSTLLLASIKAYGMGNQSNNSELPPPKWHKSKVRPSIDDLCRQIRLDTQKDSAYGEKIGLTPDWCRKTIDSAA